MTLYIYQATRTTSNYLFIFYSVIHDSDSPMPLGQSLVCVWTQWSISVPSSAFIVSWWCWQTKPSCSGSSQGGGSKSTEVWQGSGGSSKNGPPDSPPLRSSIGPSKVVSDHWLPKVFETFDGFTRSFIATQKNVEGGKQTQRGGRRNISSVFWYTGSRYLVVKRTRWGGKTNKIIS